MNNAVLIPLPWRAVFVRGVRVEASSTLLRVAGVRQTTYHHDSQFFFVDYSLRYGLWLCLVFIGDVPYSLSWAGMMLTEVMT